MNHIEALKMALEALEKHGVAPKDWACKECAPFSDMLKDGFQCKYHAAIAAIKQALAAQQEPAQDWKALAEEQAETITKMTSEKYPFAHIRIDASEAEKEGALRDKLIELGWTPPAAQPAYKDSTPQLSVGDSSFESWFGEYNPTGKGDKQRSRDAYAAGMGDPLVAPPAAQRQWVGLNDVEWMNIVNKNHAWFGMQPDEVAHEVCTLTEAKLKEKNGGAA